MNISLNERDVELIEIALESAISACVGLPGVDNTSTDGLAGEYRATLRKVQAEAGT